MSAENWFDIGTIADIPQRGARCVVTPQGRIGVFRTADDRIFAIEDHCPHRGGHLSEGIVHGAAVIVKVHPVRAHLHPIFLRLFRPLVEAGAFASLQGGAELGESLVRHPAVDSLHLTGGGATHDALVWGGPTDPLTPRRKREGTPITTKPVTSELGCITPWLLVPPAEAGAWSVSHSSGARSSVMRMWLQSPITIGWSARKVSSASANLSRPSTTAELLLGASSAYWQSAPIIL